MSPRAALILVIVMTLLVGVGFLNRSHEDAPTADAIALMPPDAGRVRSIESHRGNVTVRLERAAGPDEPWLISRILGDDAESWPADRRIVASGLRLLADAQVRRAGDGPRRDLDGSNSTGVIIGGSSGDTRIRFSVETLAGERAAEIQTDQDGAPVMGRVSDDIAGLLGPEAILAWRDKAALPLFDSGVLTIEIEGQEHSILLRRTGSRWGLVSPVVAGTDPLAVRNLLDAIAALRFSQLDATDSVNPNSAAKLTLRASSRSSGREILWTVSLSRNASSTTAGPATSSIKGLHADARSVRASGDLDGVAGFVRAASVALLVSRFAADIPGTDVAGIRIVSRSSTVESQRSARSWTSEAHLVDALLELLTQTPCTSVGILRDAAASDARENDDHSARVFTISLSRFGGLPGGEYRLAITPDSVLIRSGTVQRVYALRDEAGDPTTAQRVVDGLLTDSD